MCLHPHPVEPVPDQTAAVAYAAFPNGNRYMIMREELGLLFEDQTFVDLFPERGRPAFSPWRLALVTVMQFAENLSDRQAADAVRGRIDWKFALSLELTDPGFDASVLCEFRSRLALMDEEDLLLDSLLERFRERGLLKVRGRQRTDSTRVLASVRQLNRLELMVETMRLALNALANAVPQWLRETADPQWLRRYAHPASDRRLPDGKDARIAEASKIGQNGFDLYAAVCSTEAPEGLKQIPAVETLRRVWLHYYVVTPEGVRWRNKAEDGLPPASIRIESATDPECRCVSRQDSSWLGYKVHFTETCDDELPRLITNVETAPATSHDRGATFTVHEALAERELLPTTHLVDTLYADAHAIIESREDHGVDLLGPVRANYGWQSRMRTGFSGDNFEIDWKEMQAMCPEGKKSYRVRTKTRRGREVLEFRFSAVDCSPCPSRAKCIRPGPRSKENGKNLTVASKEHHEAQRLARERQSTPTFEQEYARRQGIEGTFSRAVRTNGLRHTRYRGLKRTHLQHTLTAAALNFARVGEWWSRASPQS